MCVTFDLGCPAEVRAFTACPSAFIAMAARKGRPEVSLKKCTAEQRAAFETAKEKETGEWLRSAALLAVKREGIPEDRLMKSRWILTFKDDGRAKARLVLMGFTEPDLLHLRADSPTVSRRGRQLFLQECANRSWRGKIGRRERGVPAGPRAHRGAPGRLHRSGAGGAPGDAAEGW